MRSSFLLSACVAATFLSISALSPVLAAQSNPGPMTRDMMMKKAPVMNTQGSGKMMNPSRGKGMMMGSGQGKGMMMGRGSMMHKMQKMHTKMMSHMLFVREKPFTNDDAKRIIGGRLAMNGLSGLRAGNVKDAGSQAAIADIVSQKGELLFRLKFNRNTGMASVVQ